MFVNINGIDVEILNFQSQIIIQLNQRSNHHFHYLKQKTGM